MGTRTRRDLWRTLEHGGGELPLLRDADRRTSTRRTSTRRTGGRNGARRRAAGPRGASRNGPGRCVACGTGIVWTLTDRFRQIPVDDEPSTDGDLAVHRSASGLIWARRLTGGDAPARGETIAARHPCPGVASAPRATLWRLRRQALPHAATLATLGGGLAAWAAAAVTGEAGTVAAGAAAAGAAITAFAALLSRRTTSPWRTRVLTAAVVATTWLALAAIQGVGPGMITGLLAAAYTLAARWWQAHRLQHHPTSRSRRTGPDRTDHGGLDEIQNAWDTYVATPNGPAPDSRLVEPEPFEHGVRYIAELVRGRQTFTSLQRSTELVAGGIGHDIEDLLLEPEPRRRGTASARVTVLSRNPVVGDIVFTGPAVDGGRLLLGPHADGTGEAGYQLYTPGSMWSGVVIAGSGMGKSRLLENIACSTMSRGDTVVWFLDPHNGASSPALRDHADWFATLSDAEDMLTAALTVGRWRGEENAAYNLTGFDASPDRPGLLIVIDESHRVFPDQKTAARWGDIAREFRKFGVTLLLADQYPGLPTFGGSEELRSSVMRGNVIAMHTRSRIAGTLMAGLQVDPLALPAIPGYAYSQASENVGGRTAPFRNRDTAGGQEIHDWMAAQPRTTLDAFAANAAGAVYRDRGADTTAVREASLRRVEALRAGDLSVLRSHHDDRRNLAPAAEPAPGGNVVAFPTAPLPTGPQPPAGLPDSQRRILAAVTAGHTRPVDIRTATGYSERQVYNLLRKLTTDGHLVNDQGRYSRPAEPAPA